MAVIRNTLGADITLEISTGTMHLVTPVFLDKWLLTFVADLDKGGTHRFFDNVFRGLFLVLLVL